MRTRDWRRYAQDKVFIRRLKKLSHGRWYKFTTVNGDLVTYPKWYDFIGTDQYFFYKNGSTDKWNTRHSSKYSPNKNTGYHRRKKIKDQSCGLREKDKLQLYRMLKEYGIR
jgi:hypothetical protein